MAATFSCFVTFLAFSITISLQFVLISGQNVSQSGKDYDLEVSIKKSINGTYSTISLADLNFSDACPEFTCADGGCFPEIERCDGVPYCFDESDEEDCTEVCTEDQFRCVDGSGCLPQSKVCDRMKDCDNGSDEKDCNFKDNCTGDEFMCKNGKCIYEMLVCDGLNHCGDNSDETNCTKAVCPTKYFDCYQDGRKCIDMDKLCDGREDCEDGEDEKECGALSEDLEHWVTQGASVDPPSEDKDCEDSSHCHHTCVMRRGMSICGCHAGFTLAEDNYSCKVKGEEPLLWLGNDTKLIGYGIYSKDVLDRHDVGHGFSAIATGFDENIFFWVNKQMNSIMKGDFGASKSFQNTEVLLRPPNAHAITALAYDWMNRNLYWAEQGGSSKGKNEEENVLEVVSKIGVVALARGNEGEVLQAPVLVSPQVHSPNALVVDPRIKNRFLFWTQVGEHAGLYRSNMDGSNIVAMAKTYVKHPVSLAIDYSYNWLVWVDGESDHMFVTHYNGQTDTLMIFEHHKSPVALTAFEGSVYWGGDKDHDFKELKVWLSTHEGETLPKLATVKSRVMAMHHSFAQPIDEEQHDGAPCFDYRDKCDHICLPTSSDYVCRCHDNELQRSRGLTYVLAEDGKTCNSKRTPVDAFPRITDVNSTRKPFVILPNLISTLPKERFDDDEIVESVTGRLEIGHEARHSDRKLEETFAEAASGGGKTTEVSMGMIWLYFTVASLLCGVLALVGVGAYKLKMSRDSRRVNSREATPLKTRGA